MPSLLPSLAALLGVASPPTRATVLLGHATLRSLEPPTPAVQAPSSLPSQPQPSSMMPELVAWRAADLAAANALSGLDIVCSPNVFRGLSAGAQPAPLEPLSRDEENELVRRALFFIASTNAERALSERAGQPAEYVMFNHAQGVYMALSPPVFDAQTCMWGFPRLTGARTNAFLGSGRGNAATGG